MRNFAVMALLLCSCAAASVTEVPVMASNEGDIRRVSDPAKTVSITVGEAFTLTLESNATTGYQWQLDRQPDAKVVRFVARDYRPPESRVVGAGGAEVWTFTGVGKGKTEISLKYVRPWEKDVPPARKAVFPVIVR